MSILLIKTSSRAISGTLSSDFTFYHWKACPARFRRLFFFSKGARPGTTCLTKVPEALASNPGTCHRRFVALPLPLPQPSLVVYVLPHFKPPLLLTFLYSNLWCIFSRYRSRTFRRCRFLSGKTSCVRARSLFTFCSSVNKKKIPFLKNIRG